MLNTERKGPWGIAAVGNDDEQINRVTTSVLVGIVEHFSIGQFFFFVG